MKFFAICLAVIALSACGKGHSDNTDQAPTPPSTAPTTKISIITGFKKGPDGNYYEELMINDRRCTVSQYYDDQTPNIDCLPPETTTTLYSYR